MTEELKPIDVSKYHVTEDGNVLKQTDSRTELEKDYYADRPIEPYSNDDSPNDWANIAHYAEGNLEKAFKRIAEAKEIIKELLFTSNELDENTRSKAEQFLKEGK